MKEHLFKQFKSWAMKLGLETVIVDYILKCAAHQQLPEPVFFVQLEE